MGWARYIQFGEAPSLLIYCADYRCSHCNVVVPDDADRWPDELRLSDIEDKFVCTTCGQRGADVRPDPQSADKPLGKISRI